MDPLKVELTSSYAKENASREHHTDVYDLVKEDPPTLILRRGENFYLHVRFKRNYDASRDVVRLIFTLGANPQITKGTKVAVLVKKSQSDFPKDATQWAAQITDNRPKTDIVVQVHIPANVPVGIWGCSVVTNIRHYPKNAETHEIKENIYIIFNPWSPKDSVYMKNGEEINEYVLNELGKIWCGTFNNPKGRHWIFGQFDDIALPAAMFLLDKSELPYAKRGDPVLVTRAISAIVNSDNDDGLLVGKFDGNYRDGTSPHTWTGSSSILYQYLQSNGRPVKYGQCWVYSAVVVTVCRALGIPCRSTTNYVSAHDIDSPYIGRYFDGSDNPNESGPEQLNDLCWSFHAWNDVWMTRPDLPPGCDGWQIIDGTPLTQTAKLKRCGPASVAAIKNGQTGYLYDTSLLFYKINADIVHYVEDDDSDTGYRRITTNRYRVGRKIVTKKLGPTDNKGNSDLLDITAVYKYPAQSTEEFEVIGKLMQGTPGGFLPEPVQQKRDVFFDLVDMDFITYGDSFDVTVRVRNESKQERSITSVLKVSSEFNGRAKSAGDFNGRVKRDTNKFRIKPEDEAVLRLHVTPEEYLPKLLDHAVLKLFAYGKVEETGQVWTEEDDLTLRAPDLTIAVSASVLKLGEMIKVNISFHNPLNEPLTDCVYTIEGPTREKAINRRFRDVKPKEFINLTDNIVVNRTGRRAIIATFTSRQIPDMTASTMIEILPSE